MLIDCKQLNRSLTMLISCLLMLPFYPAIVGKLFIQTQPYPPTIRPHFYTLHKSDHPKSFVPLHSPVKYPTNPHSYAEHDRSYTGHDYALDRQQPAGLSQHSNNLSNLIRKFIEELPENSSPNVEHGVGHSTREYYEPELYRKHHETEQYEQHLEPEKYRYEPEQYGQHLESEQYEQHHEAASEDQRYPYFGIRWRKEKEKSQNEKSQRGKSQNITFDQAKERLDRILKENPEIRKSTEWAFEMIDNITNGLQHIIPPAHLSLVLNLLDKLFFEIDKV